MTNPLLNPNSGEIFQTFATFTLLLFSSPRRSSVISQTFAQLKLSSTPIFIQLQSWHRKVMALTIVTFQFHYGGCFVSNPTLRYVNGITSVEKINIDVDELHIMLFHKIAMELGVENVETFGCRVNKNGTFYMLNTDSDVLNFLNGLKGADFVDVYVVHPISISLVVEEILVLPSTNAHGSSSPQQDNVNVSSSPHKNRVDLSSSPQIDRADVSSSQPFDENENRDLNQNQSPLVEEQAPAPRVKEHSDSDSLYDIDKNIDDLSDLDEELLQARQSNIQEQFKEKTARVNLDEIPSGPVGIDAGFEDIYKEKRGRFEGNLGGDDPYFDSSNPGSDISEDEGDPVENDEVVDPAPRKESTKMYFDPTAKKTFGHNKKGCRALKMLLLEQVLQLQMLLLEQVLQVLQVLQLLEASQCYMAYKCFIKWCEVCNFLGIWWKPTIATSSDVRQLSTQQSTSSAGGHKRKTSTTLRGDATLAYKKPRPKKAKTTGYGLLFGSGGSVTAKSGNVDRVLHSATLSSSTPTNIDLGYKPNGLRWKGRAAITQRQLREESYRSTQGTQGTH
ncbi:hypothetical protein KY290_013756 [Solanum tuberosum]|uniref:PB1-like domain-containing protein n=1 Tax=Solanum tuberosum TaxID=4113 RepID=A0ABQ7VNA5_SOLTU|nr:hypothetical protein KY289_013873 [Solanum tuberosum]KAH0769775.1 hypothetical protein KY290_013756 [Solanum tuberosum]